MPRIRCHYIDCILLDEGHCSAAAIELDPDVGCMIYKQSDNVKDDDWDEDDDNLDDWDEIDLEDDDDLWIEDDEY